jgi:hypothetical protein
MMMTLGYGKESAVMFLIGAFGFCGLAVNVFFYKNTTCNILSNLAMAGSLVVSAWMLIAQ